METIVASPFPDQGNAIPQEVDSPDAPDQDRDEDTESSTEEAIDDRIESEQSEAGSLSAQNDVGDLSVFADIGDLPLVAGDVPRNYIHRPNNHLSTVLNIIVVLVAILTMGISLGIIMGRSFPLLIFASWSLIMIDVCVYFLIFIFLRK